MENEGNQDIWEYLKKFDLIVKAVSISGSVVIFAILNFNTDPKIFELGLVLCNFIFALYYFVWLSKDNPPQLLFKEDNRDICKKNYCEELELLLDKKINGKDNPDHKEERANKLVEQFNKHIRGYVLWLLIVYLFFIIRFLIELQTGIDLTGDQPEQHQNELLFGLFFKLIIDVFNYLSAISIYLAFKVLYDKTLDDITNESNGYKSGAISFSICYIAFYVVFLLIKGVDLYNPTTTNPTIAGWLPLFSSWFSLLAGIINGVAMALLFGRYVSMEHRIISRKTKNKYAIISWGIVHILPVYAVIQPLFGSFNLKTFGDSDKFRNFVFFICLLGKIFFLLITNIFIREKFLHLYLHLVINKHGVPKKFLKCFDIPEEEEPNLNIEEESNSNREEVKIENSTSKPKKKR